MSSVHLVVALLTVGATHAAPHQPCAGPASIPAAPVLSIEKSGAIVLANKQTVHLEGIRLPNGALDRAPVDYSARARAEINLVARAHALTLQVVAPARDRYGRLRAQAFSHAGWLQGELLRQGLARVALAPDRTECAGELYAAEAEARQARRGLWSIAAYAIREPEDLWPDIGTFQVVEGKVLNASSKNGRAYLNFGSDWRRDFTVTVDPGDMINFRTAGVDPLSYVGQTIRVRGWVQLLHGPEIEVANPQSIEVVR